MSSGVAAKDVSFAPGAGEIFAGHYRIEGVLGTGGMGVVLAAVDARSGAKVAIKLLRSAEEQRAVDRFFREAKAMSRLSTEHVVRIFEEGTAEERPYLVMERLDGKDFAEQARGGKRLPVQAVADAIVQACEALSHAHSAGIIHRDLKPSNLFLHAPPGGRAVVKLLDFGISKVKSKEEWEKTLTATNDGGVLGSPPYMSPEQVRDPKKVDARSDVWALGIVMYKLLAGRLPFDGESVGEVFARVLERPYPSLRTFGGIDVPPELDAIVARCLAKDRRDRWQNTGELALALSAFASPEWAPLARTTAQRMKDDPPTIDDPGLRIDPSPFSSAEPSTLDGQDPGVFGPVVATPYDGVPMVSVAGIPPAITPHSGIQALHPSLLVPVAPGTGGGLAQRPVTASTFGPAVIDPRLVPVSVPPPSSPRSGVGAGGVLAVVALVAVLGALVAVKLPRGARGMTTTSAGSATTGASAAAPAESVAAAPSATVSPSTSAPASAGVTSVGAVSSPPVPVGSGPRPRRPGGRPAPSGAGQAGGASVVPSTSSASAPQAPSARPELHDNPYLRP